MKVYFACSITGGRDHAHTYQDIVDYINASGAGVLSEIFADKTIEPLGGPGTMKNLTSHEIWKYDLSWIKQADALIAEVTQPSLGVGYEIAKAGQWDKPILALFYKKSGKRLSPMVAGDPNVTVFEYDDISATKAIVKKFIDKLKLQASNDGNDNKSQD